MPRSTRNRRRAQPMTLENSLGGGSFGPLTPRQKSQCPVTPSVPSWPPAGTLPRSRPQTPSLAIRPPTRVRPTNLGARSRPSRIPIPISRHRVAKAPPPPPPRTPESSVREDSSSENEEELVDAETLQKQLSRYYTQMIAARPTSSAVPPPMFRHQVWLDSAEREDSARRMDRRDLGRLGDRTPSALGYDPNDGPRARPRAGPAWKRRSDQPGRFAIREKLEACLVRGIPFLPKDVLEPEELVLFRRFEEIQKRRRTKNRAKTFIMDPDLGRIDDFSSDELDLLYGDLQAAVKKSQQDARNKKKPVNFHHFESKRIGRLNSRLGKLQGIRGNGKKLSKEDEEDVLRLRDSITRKGREQLLFHTNSGEEDTVVSFLEWMRHKEKEDIINITIENAKLYKRIQQAKSVYSRQDQLEDFRKHQAFVVYHRPIANLDNLKRLPMTSKTANSKPFSSMTVLKPFDTRITRTRTRGCSINRPITPSGIKKQKNVVSYAYKSPLCPPPNFDPKRLRRLSSFI